MQTLSERSLQRRTTAASLKVQTLAFLAKALPEGWISQPLSPVGAGQLPAAGKSFQPVTVDGRPAADILIISPRGRCHFLFVRAPADRWWDGGPRSVPAEKFTERETRLARRLRAAGHEARPIWGERELGRALQTWGCPWNRDIQFGGARQALASKAPAKPVKRKLHLGSWRRQADA